SAASRSPRPRTRSEPCSATTARSASRCSAAQSAAPPVAASRGPHDVVCASWGGTERSGAQGSPRATEPGCGAEPHVSSTPNIGGLPVCSSTLSSEVDDEDDISIFLSRNEASPQTAE